MSMAVILVGGIVVGGTVAAVGSHNAGKDAAGAAGAASKQLRSDSTKAAAGLEKYKNRLGNPQLMLLDAIKGNLANLPQINRLAEGVNKGNQAELNRMLQGTLPGYRGGVKNAIQNTLSWIRGEIPDDVAAQIKNRTAETALRGGFAGSASARALQARDLGKTSLDLMSAGENSLQRWLATARESLMPKPFDPTAFFISPEMQFRSIEDAAGIAEKQAQIQLGGANAATAATLSGRQAEIAATREMYQQIGSTISGAAGAAAGGAGTGGVGGLGRMGVSSYTGAPPGASGMGSYQNYLNASGGQFQYDPAMANTLPTRRY